MISINDLIGKTFISVIKLTTDFNGDELVFETENEKFIFYHEQDCCENVYIDDITGDLQDLENSPLLIADERSQDKEVPDGSSTWTFYEFRTVKGSVTVRWIGESNGYYSESVNLRKEKK